MFTKLNIAFLVTKLSKAAPILYVQTLVEQLSNFAYIEIFYFDDVLEVDFPCLTTRINFKDDFHFKKFQIVHSHGLRPDIYIALNKSKINAVCISTIHSYIKYDLKSQYNTLISYGVSKIWLQALDKFDCVVALSNDMRKYYQKFLKHSEIIYIHSGHHLPPISIPLSNIDIDKISNFKLKTTLIGVIANLRKQKGVNQIIDALSLDHSYSLIVIGEGKVRKMLERQARRLRCSDRCMFLGHQKDAHKYLPLIDIYAMVSYQEGFGLVNIEAGLNKKPIVCSDIKIFRELFDEESVAFFELDNTKSLINALNKIKSNYTFFSRNLYNLVSVKFTPKKMFESYYSLYINLLNQHPN